MATWVTHFRIAEKLIEAGLFVSNEEFLVGNIGPDCGLYGDGGILNPPKAITHFEIEGKTNAKMFYDQYILNNGNGIERKRFSFYLGYYLHLVTDQEWRKLQQQKKEEKIYQDRIGTPDYWDLIKQDWYGLDFQYLKNNSNNIFWTTFQNVSEFPDYLDIFPNGQVNEQIKRITKFYLENTIDDDQEFIFLTSREVDEFVEHTVLKIREILNTRMGKRKEGYG